MELCSENRKWKIDDEELYSLVDQIRRSSRSVPVNIRGGFAKRKYPDVFSRHLNDALGSSEETLTWLEFAHKADYLTRKEFEGFNQYQYQSSIY